MKKRIKFLLSMTLIIAMLLSNTISIFATETTPAAAVNTVTGQAYDDLSTALNNASAGDRISLNSDVTATLVSILSDVELDLNGHTLTASYVTCFGNLTDRSAHSEGVLKVPQKHLLIQNTNAQLPVKTKDGYRFFDVSKFNTAYQKDLNRFAFQPFISANGHELLSEGSENTGVTVNVRVSWKQNDGKRFQYFIYNDDKVNTFLNSYYLVDSTEKYGQMFTLTLFGAEKFEELTLEIVVASDTGVAFSSEPVTPDYTEETPEPEQPQKPWEGKNVTILGDSISTGAYPAILAELSGATLQNISKSGKRLTGDFTTMVEQVSADADLVIIYGGTNDYWHKNVNIGTAESTGTTTYNGALRYLLNYLQINHPNAKYMFVFPPDQTFSGNTCTKDFGKGTLADFRSAFLYFCEENNVPYLNLGDTEFDSTQHTTDGVHPNDTGHQLIAQAINDAISQIK